MALSLRIALLALAALQLASCLPSSSKHPSLVPPLSHASQRPKSLRGGLGIPNPLPAVGECASNVGGAVGGAVGAVGGVVGGVASKLPCFGGDDEMKPAARGKIPTKSLAKPNPIVENYFKLVEFLTLMFPVWTVLLSIIALLKPESFSWLTTEPFTVLKIGGFSMDSDLYTMFLGFIMLSMGITLTFDDFARTSQFPLPIGVGYLCQYIVKPILGWALAQAMHLSTPLGTGLVLLSCCPGGQASNVATFIAGGDLPLSVLMTLASTVTAVFMTPLLVKVFAGAQVDVDGLGMMLSVLSVVIVPTSIGLLLNQFLPAVTEFLKPITPLLGVVLTSCLCAAPIAGISDVLKEYGFTLAIPVFALHVLAFGAGYVIPRFGLQLSEGYSRTISIETGMQSAALGYLLARKHFSDPLTAVPSAVGVFAMASLGSALAVFWRSIGGGAHP
eukprot:CAMPEP_0173437654 /NCGR_PEP_ID=MMETSP1357-20121228/18140_1 /TAXON_ID=77926 /ORGANISM="Hemiselmis rufescens, Strain PCC563" /LENGTH=444 /DNA_ID=CAMNT_0014402847 /DNA_START=6 /DNA_END=1340 /DNA_ORIENTATION=-